jgi:uncharacterized membrane protein (DUF2068 family)
LTRNTARTAAPTTRCAGRARVAFAPSCLCGGLYAREAAAVLRSCRLYFSIQPATTKLARWHRPCWPVADLMNAAAAKAPSDRHGARRRRAHPRDGVLKVIAFFKLAKALLLIGVGLGALNLLNPMTADKAERWASALAWRLGPGAAFAVHNRFSRLHNPQLTLVGIVSFLYAGLFAIEGVGLWRSKRWAEYLTIIATSSFVPFEVYELIRHASGARLATLGINLAVVGYLVWKVRQRDG